MTGLGQVSLLPFDGQQPLAEYAIVFAGSRESGAHLKSAHREQQRPELVENVEVRLDARGVGLGQLGEAIPRIASRSVGTQLTHAQGQQQAAVGDLRHAGMGRHRLEAGIQQRGMHPVAGVLGTDRDGQPDLGQHRVTGPPGVCTLTRPAKAGP